MRFKVNRSIHLLFIAVGLASCARVTATDIRAANRSHLNALAVGMTKGQVLQVMGNATVQTYDNSDPFLGSKSEVITNPYRTEAYESRGVRFEVLYYYTDVKAADGAITDDELTPLVLVDGKLDGWGWGYWRDLISRYEIRIR